VTPHATEIPERANKFISEHPPVIDPHFPNFKVWLEKPWPMHGGKRVRVYTKSSGIEPPIVYRDTAWPSPLEKELLGFGDEHEIDFVFTKDGVLFTDEGLAGFDAILFFTSGDARRNRATDSGIITRYTESSSHIQCSDGFAGTGFGGARFLLLGRVEGSAHVYRPKRSGGVVLR
jgi:hypothetical protein